MCIRDRSYILLSGWDTYTYALFSEELNVSKNVIMDDINELDAELLLFGIKVHRTAGYGIYATGSELDIRKAMRHFLSLIHISNSHSEFGVFAPYTDERA